MIEAKIVHKLKVSTCFKAPLFSLQSSKYHAMLHLLH